MSLALWFIPIASFMTAFALLTRRFRRTRIKRLVLEKTHRAEVNVADSVEAPALTGPERNALGLPASVSAGSHASGAQARDRRPLPPEKLEPVCRKFGVRELSLLPSEQAGGREEGGLEILVEFEPQARVDSSVAFRLRLELSVLLGRPLSLVCKNRAAIETEREAFARAHVLYAF